MLRNSTRGSVIGRVFPLLIIAGIAYYIYANSGPSPEERHRQYELATPEGALKAYFTNLYKLIHHEEGGTAENLKKLVTPEDWDWYNANYQRMHMDVFGITSVINSGDAEELSRESALKYLYEAGPGTSAEIVSSTTNGDEAHLQVKYYRPSLASKEPVAKQREVVLIKSGGVWQVKDFAGARTDFK